MGLLLAVVARSTTASRSSIRSAPTPGPAGDPAGWRSRATRTARPATAHGIRKRTGTAGSPRAGRRLQPQRQDRAPHRLGHLLHAGVLPRLGRRHLAGRLLERRRRSRARSAASSRRSSSIRASRRTSRRRPTSASDYRNGQGILYRPLDANERPYAHQWNITVDRELGQQPLAERRLRRQRRPAAAVEHRSAQRDRPGYLSMGNRAERRVHAGHDQPERRAAAVRRVGGADDRLRAVGGAGAHARIRSTATTSRGSTRATASRTTTRCRSSSRSASRAASTRSCPTPSRRRSSSGSDNTQRDAVTWSGAAGRHLAVRAGAEQDDCRRRHAARAVGSVRLRAAVRRGQEIR